MDQGCRLKDCNFRHPFSDHHRQLLPLALLFAKNKPTTREGTPLLSQALVGIFSTAIHVGIAHSAKSRNPVIVTGHVARPKVSDPTSFDWLARDLNVNNIKASQNRPALTLADTVLKLFTGGNANTSLVTTLQSLSPEMQDQVWEKLSLDGPKGTYRNIQQ